MQQFESLGVPSPHTSVALCSLRLLAATALFSGSTAPASAAQHEPVEPANAANTFLLRPEPKGSGIIRNISMLYTDPADSRRKGEYPVKLPAVLQSSLIKKEVILHDWVWWCIIIIAALILVSCLLWLFCLRWRSRSTLSPNSSTPLVKTEDANGNGNHARQTTPRNNVNGSPSTPVKTPLAMLTTAARSSSAEQLCPDLIVSESAEIRFALMQNIFSWTPRQASKVLDSNGQCIANAVGTCIGNDRLALRGPTDDLLCEVQRRSLDYPDQNIFDIFHPHGQLFGVLEKDTLNPTFTVTSALGTRLLVLQGDFRRKEIDITDPASGDQLAQTGHGFFACNRVGHYQVRVASGVDAGLIMACCLAIDEAEF